MGIWILSSFELTQIVLLWTFLYMFLVVHIPIPIECMACDFFFFKPQIDSNVQTGLDIFTL